MKKNLNIAYLNGAEGMIRRGGASSGGSGDQFSYYRVNHNDDSYDPSKVHSTNGLSLMKGTPYDTTSIYDGDICIGIPDFFSRLDLVIAVCGTALPIKFKDKIIDYGDWKRNYAEAIATVWPEVSIEQVLNDHKFLEPITKEEFYNLDNSDAPEESMPK